MSNPFSFTTCYQLDKAHFVECFEESVAVQRPLKRYAKSLALAAFGFLLFLLADSDPYVAGFIVVLGFIDGLSVYYQKPWWVARQMLSKEAGSEVRLSFDEQSMTSKSVYRENTLLWADVVALEKTARGWLVVSKAGKNYISSSCLSDEAEAFLLNHCSPALIKS
ncbi:MAG: YcxB family protein [Pseudomonadales bacterium]|nr:YcxB family protein [Pseudomonadales bacterium]